MSPYGRKTITPGASKGVSRTGSGRGSSIGFANRTGTSASRQPGSSLGRYASDRSGRSRKGDGPGLGGSRFGSGGKSSSGSSRLGSSTSGSKLGSSARGSSLGKSPTQRLKPLGPVITTRPGRRPGGGYDNGYGYGSGYGSGYGYGHGYKNRNPYGWGSSYYNGRLCYDYCYSSYGYCYPWRYYRPWRYNTWGLFWGYYSWPRYCYSDPYWGSSYPIYSSTVYVYSDGASEAGYYDPVEEPIVVGAGASSRPAEEDPEETEPGTEDLTLARHYSSLGDLYMRTRRYARALDSYERAVKLAPEDGSLRFVLADALFQLGKLDECAYQIRKGLALDPGLADVEVDKRTFFDWPEDFDTEMVKLEKKVAAEPFQANIRLVLAYNYRMTKRYAEARRELTTLTEQLPGDEAIHLMLNGLNTLPPPK